ncbi:L,D-transpeptidase family protein [Microbacterium rhizomatis]|uniref:L,D-transpeptidase family protein n=1 Tax=Microbacterium rhizomatis TaxID=1631477 RepID=A0A5J5J5P6_9MICO|nr:L,D-transpeptidase family protein [Microbacterium rhizomatis]KAA9111341.1 L,D-transpeptidase family protein [Microbacterium rhizomatis]
MTDLATRPGADSASDDGVPTASVTATIADDAVVGDAAVDTTPATPSGVNTTAIDNAAAAEPAYAWAPAEPARKKKRLGLWIGIPAGVALVALVAASLTLIAPGTTVGGVAVGGMTAGGAADALQQRLDNTTIVLTGDGVEATVTAGQLGASVARSSTSTGVEIGAPELGARIDAKALADAAFAQHPAWNPTAWFSSPATTAVTLNADSATAALRKAAPRLYKDPVDAAVAFDAGSAAYVVTPAVEGQGVDIAAVQAAVTDAFNTGRTRVEVAAQAAPIEAKTTTTAAQSAADKLNNILNTAGFYVGTERTVPVDKATVASWITLSTGADGAVTYDVNQAAIQTAVDALPAAVNRAPVNATVITDSEGGVLQEESAGVTGRALGATDNVAAAFATQLKTGNAVYELPVTETAFTTTNLARRIEVNLSEQRATLFENEQVVQSWLISSGRDGYNTATGHFRVFAKLDYQNMGNPDLTKAPNYYTPDVPNVMYYNGDEALHGAYWHNNFGNQMSHGCVNMPLSAAAYTFDWAPMGTEVWVHY